MTIFNQWHIEEIELDTDSNTQGAIPVIYGRQGDKDGILCNIKLLQQGVPASQAWFRGKRVFYEARGNGVSVRKQVDQIVNGIVKVVIPEAAFKNIGLVPENFLRVEDASTGSTIISATTSFKLYVRAGSLDPGASKYYLDEIERIATNFNKWIDTIKGALDKDPALSLANSIATLREYVDAKNLEVTQARGNYGMLEGRLDAADANRENILQFTKDQFFANGKVLALSELPLNANGEAAYNGTSYVQDNLTIYNGNQYAVWVGRNKRIVVGKRKVGTGKWETHTGTSLQDYFGDFARNEHLVICIAVDKFGYIHLSGNMHAQDLKYARSNRPEDITSWGSRGMTRTEAIVTYPRFVKTKSGELLFFYRTGTSTTGNTIMNRYNALAGTWQIGHAPLINGSVSNENPYLNRVVCDDNNVIHVTGCFRGLTGTKSNNDIFYMKSEDEGLTWKKSNGKAYMLPVTHASAELILDTPPPNAGLINQCGMDVDINGNPHVTYFRLSKDGKTNIHHLYKSGSSWVEEQITDFNTILNAEASGWTANLTRPSLFCYEDRTFILYATKYNGGENLLKLQEVTPGRKSEPVTILNLPLGTWEPTFDSEALKLGILSMLIVPSGPGMYWDNFYNQYAGVLSIDLKQIDKVVRDEVPIPTLRTIRGIQSEVGSIVIKQGNGAVALPKQPELITVEQDRTLFARLVMRGFSKNARLLLYISHINVNDPTPIFTILNSVALVNQDSTTNVQSAWQPIPQNTGNSLLTVGADVKINSGTETNASISGYAIEVAYLE